MAKLARVMRVEVGGGLEIVPVSRMDEVLARAMTRKPEPIEWEETTITAAAVPEEAPVEEEASTLCVAVCHPLQ
jgi:ATP-dependent Lon protease